MRKFIVLFALVCSACGTLYQGNAQSTLTAEQSQNRQGSTFMVYEGSGHHPFVHHGHYQQDPISGLESISEACNHSLRARRTSEGFSVRCF